MSPISVTGKALAAGSALVLLAVFPASLAAQTCTVPGTHGTVQEALDDLTCALVQLAAQTYAESLFVTRTVALEGEPGGGTVVTGALRAAGTGVVLTAASLSVVNGCPGGAMTADLGARIEGHGVLVTASSFLPCPGSPIFADGFESGET